MSAEEQVITGSVAITEADLAQGIGALSTYYRLRWFILLAFLAMLGALRATATVPVQQWGAYAAIFGLFCVWVFFSPRLAARKLLRVLVKAGDNQVLYRFDAEGGTVRASGATTTFAYRVLTRVRESRATLFLTIGAGSTSLVPKRAFSPEDLARLRQLLAANVKKIEKVG